MKKLLLFILVVITVLGCNDIRPNSEVDDELIRDYLTKNNIDAIKHKSGLYYIIEKEGNGEHPTIYDNVEVLCLGYFLDGVVFQKDNVAVKGPLRDFYAGWQYGIPLFSKGGKGKLFLPRNLGKGDEVRIFDVNLRNVW